METTDLDITKLKTALDQQSEWSKCAIFDEQGVLLLDKACAASSEELKYPLSIHV